MPKEIIVEVAYAKPEEQVILPVKAMAGDTIEMIIQKSGILERFPEIDLSTQAVGIFSEPRPLTAQVWEETRVEIYRPLVIDPKVARRKRAREG